MDQRIELKGCDGPIRQLIITDLGHEEPTLLLTNQLKRSTAQLIERYARRMIIENNIQDSIDFFHRDATATVDLSPDHITVRFQKRAHNPLLLNAGFDKKQVRIPWLDNRQLLLIFG